MLRLNQTKRDQGTFAGFVLWFGFGVALVVVLMALAVASPPSVKKVEETAFDCTFPVTEGRHLLVKRSSALPATENYCLVIGTISCTATLGATEGRNGGTQLSLLVVCQHLASPRI